jgi:hypothetical protein
MTSEPKDMHAYSFTSGMTYTAFTETMARFENHVFTKAQQ